MTGTQGEKQALDAWAQLSGAKFEVGGEERASSTAEPPIAQRRFAPITFLRSARSR